MTQRQWSPAELARIGDAEEIEIAPDRADARPGPSVTIWVVRVHDAVFVRSYRGPSGGWYRRAVRSGRGQLRAAGRAYEVTFAAGPSLRGPVDAAYRAKYGRYGAGYTATMTSDTVAQTTLELLPTH